MLREQREEIFNTLMVFEESTEEKTFKKYNKFKEQIEEIKRDFPEDKKNWNICILNTKNFENACRNCVSFLIQAEKELKSGNITSGRSIEIRLKAEQYQTTLQKGRSLCPYNDLIKKKASVLLNSGLDDHLMLYKSYLGFCDDKLLRELSEIRKTTTNIYKKAACNSIKSLTKRLHDKRREFQERYLEDMISGLMDLKKSKKQ